MGKTLDIILGGVGVLAGIGGTMASLYQLSKGATDLIYYSGLIASLTTIPSAYKSFLKKHI